MTPFGKLIFTIIVLGGIGLGWYLLSTPSIPQTQTPGTQNQQATGTVPVEEKKLPFSRFIQQGGSHVCTVNQHVANIDTTGTIYLNDGKTRGEFTITYGGKNIDSTFIIRDGYTYTWTSMTPTMGFKIKVSTSTEEKPQSSGTSTEAVSAWSAEQVGDYTCQDWVVDTSKFTLPSNVKFTPLNQ